MQPNTQPAGTARSWWKPSPDTLAAYLSPQELRRLIAGSASFAPPAWQARAKETLGARLGREILGAGRGLLSVATLGISEVVFMLSTPGKLAAEPSLPPLDLVVGPTEAAILIVDGKVDEVLTSGRMQTHDFWDKFQMLLSRGPHLEVVMVDLSQVLLSLSLELEANGELVSGQLEAMVAIEPALAHKALSLVSYGKQFLVDQPGSNAEVATFVSLAGLSARVQRHLQGQLPLMLPAATDARMLRTDAAVRLAMQQACEQFVREQLLGYGMVTRDVRLQVARTGDEEQAIRRRSAELDRQRKDLLAEYEVVDRRRQQTVRTETLEIDTQEAIARGGSEARVAQAGEGNRFALARMVLLDDQQLDEIRRDGFAKKRESERTQEALDAKHALLLEAQAHAAALERELAGAKSGAEVARIQMELEKERLKIAALAQEQNLLNLRKLREIEREDAVLRDRERMAQEKERISSMSGLTPEQMLALMADRSPDVAKALMAKFTADGQNVQRSAAEQMALMQKMQAEMAALMRESLQANSQVARGLVQGTTDMERARAVSGGGTGPECSSCRARLQPTWRACPFCGTAV